MSFVAVQTFQSGLCHMEIMLTYFSLIAVTGFQAILA